MVQVGGTDNPPTVFASARPAATLGLGVGMAPCGKFSSGAGNGLTGAGPSPGQVCSPFHPLTILSVWVPVNAPTTSKGRATTPRLPSGMSAANVAKPAGKSTKMEIRLAIVLSGSEAAGAAAAAPCSALRHRGESLLDRALCVAGRRAGGLTDRG